MKKIAIFLLLVLTVKLSAQQTIYNPKANAQAEIDAAIEQAAKENKHVLIQVGGNWCPWCVKLHNYCDTVEVIDSILKADYLLVRVNYSKENKNTATLNRLEYPQRFGFPVLLVLDTNGKRIHTQDSGLLEAEGAYDSAKLKRFLLSWNTTALDSHLYK